MFKHAKQQSKNVQKLAPIYPPRWFALVNSELNREKNTHNSVQSNALRNAHTDMSHAVQLQPYMQHQTSHFKRRRFRLHGKKTNDSTPSSLPLGVGPTNHCNLPIPTVEFGSAAPPELQPICTRCSAR